MAAQDIPRGNVSDFLALGATWSVFDGPNLQSSPDNLTQVNSPGGAFLQSDVTRRKVTGTSKAYAIDDGAVAPTSGALWAITGASAAPYSVRIDDVNYEGQTEDGYEAISVTFHYFETIADETMVLTDMTDAPA